MRNWELAKSQRDPLAGKSQLPAQDFVCISREVGVGANGIGALLAERLDWPVFDKEILHKMAGDDRIRKQIYESMDERDLGWCEETLRSVMQPEFVKNDYFHRLSQTILSLARQGSAVFVGRGADLILPRDVGLRIRIVAPLEVRVKRLAGRLSISEEEARLQIDALEEERAKFVLNHFHIDVNDSQRYDLVINAHRVTMVQIVDLIESAREIFQSEQTLKDQYSSKSG
jgi:cytidylate kinase